MQAQASSTDPFCGSTDSTEVPEHGSDVRILSNFAQSVVISPLSRLHEVTLAQEDVSRARQDLLVERSKTRSAGEAVRLQRIVTGNVEGQLLNALREFYNANAKAFPASITEAYGKAIQERDRLGSIEDGYFEAERTLGGSEWRFMQKEEMLYQYHFPDLRAHMDSALSKYTDPPPPPPPDPVLIGNQTVLVHNAPPPPPPPHTLPLDSREPVVVVEPSPINRSMPNSVVQLEEQYKSAVTELDNLRKEFDSLRPQQSELLELEFGKRRTHIEASEHRVRSQVLFEQYSTLLTKLAEKEVEVQHLRQTRWGTPDINTDMSRRMSDEWMLDYVKTNPMERKMYMNVLEETGILMPHGDSLDEWSERYWFSHATNSSSADGPDSIQAVGNRPHTDSSTSSNMDKSVQTNATPQGYDLPTTQPAPQQSPLLILDKASSHSRDYEICSERFAYGAPKSDTASHPSDPAEPNFHPTDLWVPKHSSDHMKRSVKYTRVRVGTLALELYSSRETCTTQQSRSTVIAQKQKDQFVVMPDPRNGIVQGDHDLQEWHIAP
ncbi:hypothetical protein P171DRAFT_525612 [Karstenula rhodostoma CBS 690.94]|uniref:Uncharacterized protein n=1 Tax=Karstenula rhodostoma CBS 690.94 TaxID=1392251 RepID=A0A9P4P886_9PLEO|nr:hypothetical protein P171DRAFT_525612 [Karstenula rhodostoma CBS 690.94]